MPKEIRHLRTEDRKIIHRMLKDKKPQTEIARTLVFSQSCISKEISRNSGKRGYRPKQAQAKPANLQHQEEKKAHAASWRLVRFFTHRFGGRGVCSNYHKPVFRVWCSKRDRFVVFDAS